MGLWLQWKLTLSTSHHNQQSITTSLTLSLYSRFFPAHSPTNKYTLEEIVIIIPYQQHQPNRPITSVADVVWLTDSFFFLLLFHTQTSDRCSVLYRVWETAFSNPMSTQIEITLLLKPISNVMPNRTQSIALLLKSTYFWKDDYRYNFISGQI